MRAAVALERDGSADVILEILGRLWETKRQSIALVEAWRAMTADAEIRAGLATHLVDERRHFRILSDEIKRRGGRPRPLEYLLRRPFALALAQPKDVYRLSIFYRGIKAFTFQRCGHLIPVVDRPLACSLEQIAREEERHIRWAEIRLARLHDAQEKRRCSALVDQVESALDTVWSKPWRRLTAIGLRRAS